MTSWGLPLAHELVDPAGITQPDVNIPVRVDPTPVARSPARKARQHLAGGVQHTDARRRPVHTALADVDYAVTVDRDIHRPLDIGPDVLKLPVQTKHLNAMVLPIAHVDLAVRDDQAVRQVEMAWGRLARLAPGLFQLAVPREPVHTGVAVAIGDIEISGRRWYQFAGVIERTRSPRHQIARPLAA